MHHITSICINSVLRKLQKVERNRYNYLRSPTNNFTYFLNQIFMLKNILRLLAASTSFVALLLITNPAIASIPVTNLDQQWRSPVVSLNVVSPSLQLAVSNQETLVNHFGCSCAVCIQSLQNNSQI
jgi:hypothetical protein